MEIDNATCAIQCYLRKREVTQPKHPKYKDFIEFIADLPFHFS